MTRVAEYVQYADAFGWTPDQVDDLPADVEPWLIPVLNLTREVQSEQQRRQAPGDGQPGR